jgi:broad specificity phosphatase PhoE
MSTLLLVRHAQASFLQADYDRLSPLGEEQARCLGTYWARRRQSIDEVWVGPRRRQLDTCRIVGEVLEQAGLAWPEPKPMAELDEYHAEAVLKRVVPDLGQHDDEVRALAQAFAGASERRERGRAFERLFQAVARRWVRGEVVAPEAEPWDDFLARIRGGVATLTDDERGRGRTVVAFTSAGAIGAALGAALPGLGDEALLELGWVVRNAALCEILFSGGRLTLSAFNTTAHLDEPRLVTYR